MDCSSCLSSNQAEFLSEISIRVPGPKNVTKPPVLLFPKVLICLDCGAAQFTTPTDELAQLAGTEQAADEVAAEIGDGPFVFRLPGWSRR